MSAAQVEAAIRAEVLAAIGDVNAELRACDSTGRVGPWDGTVRVLPATLPTPPPPQSFRLKRAW